MKKYALWLFVLIVFVGCKKDDDKDKVVELDHNTTYTFKVEVQGKWTAENHPADFPAGARFGAILGVSHYDENTLFAESGIAPSWMKSYFTSESTADFTTQLAEYKEGGKVDALFLEDGFLANDKQTFEFTTEGTHNKISFVMPLVPSPDWFVALHNINLDRLAMGGSAVYIAQVMDAGVFSGTTYTEKGNATNEAVSFKNDKPVNTPNKGVNKFAIVTIQFKGAEKKQ